MAEFTLDTSGEVRGARLFEQPDGAWRSHWQWSDLDAFAQGYIAALFASAQLDCAHARDCEYVTSEGPAPCTCPAGKFGYRRPLRFDWLAPETLAAILADCAEAFRVLALDPNDRGEGGCFWRLRNAGTFPGFPPLAVTLGDDGKVYLNEAAR